MLVGRLPPCIVFQFRNYLADLSFCNLCDQVITLFYANTLQVKGIQKLFNYYCF